MDEDKAILLVVSLDSSDRQLKEILFYSNHYIISFEDIKASLQSKEKFDLKVWTKKGEGLLVKSESLDHRNTNKPKFERHKFNKFVNIIRCKGT